MTISILHLIIASLLVIIVVGGLVVPLATWIVRTGLHRSPPPSNRTPEERFL